METTATGHPIATRGESAIQQSASPQLLLPAPASSRTGRAALVLSDRWNKVRNDLRLMVEAHMVAAPLIASTAGFLTGRILQAAARRPRC